MLVTAPTGTGTVAVAPLTQWHSEWSSDVHAMELGMDAGPAQPAGPCPLAGCGRVVPCHRAMANARAISGRVLPDPVRRHARRYHLRCLSST